jgi:quinol monooxygenase YgiN
MTTHVKITAILTAHPERTDDLWSLLDGMAPHCRAEPGNLRWDVWRDQSQRGRFVLDELYVDDDAVAAHRATPHYQDYLARIPEIADRVAVVCDPAQVAGFGS